MDTNEKEVNEEEEDTMDECPKCHAHRVVFDGVTGGGEQAMYRCKNCGHTWTEIY